jgi:hypothetical protein
VDGRDKPGHDVEKANYQTKKPALIAPAFFDE